MKKICYYFYSYPLISETFIHDQIQYLNDNNYKISITAHDLVSNNLKYYDQNELVNELFSNSIKRIPYIKDISVNYNFIPYRLKKFLQKSIELLACYRLNKYDLVIAHFADNAMPIAKAKKMGIFKKPLLTYIHGYDVGIPLFKNNIDIYCDVFDYSTKLISINNFFIDKLNNHGFEKTKMTCLYLGVDIKEFEFIKSRNFKKLNIITVSRLVEKKGIIYAIEALKIFNDQHPEVNWSYKIVGNGEKIDEIKSLINQYQLHDKILLLGPQPHDYVKKSLKESNVFLLPSITASNGDVEGIPVSLMEAMSSGLVVLSTYHSGIPELIHHKQSGLLSEEKSSQGIADNLAWLINNESEIPKLLENAKTKVYQDFNADKQNLKLLDIVENLTET